MMPECVLGSYSTMDVHSSTVEPTKVFHKNRRIGNTNPEYPQDGFIGHLPEALWDSADSYRHRGVRVAETTPIPELRSEHHRAHLLSGESPEQEEKSTESTTSIDPTVTLDETTDDGSTGSPEPASSTIILQTESASDSTTSKGFRHISVILCGFLVLTIAL